MIQAKQSPLFYVIFSSIIAGVSGVLFGYDTGVISGALIFLKPDFHLSSFQEGLIVSILLFGAAFGSLVIGRVSDKLGRKNLLIITSLLFIAGTLGLTNAANVNQLYIYRFILGCSIGIASFAAPSYISEIAPANIRGRLVSFFQLSIVIGILLTYIVNYVVSSDAWAWRAMFFYGIIPAIILLLGLMFLPESPRWLILKGKTEQAIKSLIKLRGDNYQVEFDEIQSTIALEKQEQTKQRLSSVFNKVNLPIIALAILIMLFQQLSGINAIIYYAPQIFIHAGLAVNSSLFGTILIGVVNLVSTIIGLFLLDKVGRRPLMMLGSLLMAIALLTVALTLGNIQNQVSAYIGITGVLVYIFAFAISSGLCGWLIISEVFPLRFRGQGAAIGAAANWIFNILVSFSFPLILAQFGITAIFTCFAVVCIISLIYYAKYLPETKNITLEEFEANLLKGRSSRDFGAH